MDQSQQSALQASPTVDLASIQASDNVTTSAILKQAADLFLEHGCLVLKSAFDPQFIAMLHRDFVKKYNRYFQDTTFPDALKVGDKRTMVTLRVESYFNSPELYANFRTFNLLKYLLSDAMILGSMGAVSALPGAQRQHVHRDHANIFDTTTVYPGGDRCYPVLPPYAITVVVPLVALDELTGSTRMWPGSHLVLDNQAMAGPAVEPMVALGDCYLMDYRLMHGGMPNRSEIVRPILYNVYYRPWFRDYQNYPLQTALSMTETERAKVPAAYRGLFDWSFAQSNAARMPTEAKPNTEAMPSAGEKANASPTGSSLLGQNFYTNITLDTGDKR
jgi:ectoine hydroxylase-related dioxygenase (phytanoyl-CoA dioxygenase family)